MLNNVSDDKIQEAWRVVRLMEDTFNNILPIRPHNNNPNRSVTPIQSNQNILFNQFDQLTSIHKASGFKKPNKKFLQDRICYDKSYGLLQTQKKELLKADTASSQDQENIIQ
ncbi:19031_t:CDS:2, partial [Cetraspora pellucida]